MKCLAICATLFVVVAAVPTEKLNPLSDEFIAQTNQKATTWVAGRNFDADQYDNVKRWLSGVIKSPKRPADGVNVIKNPHNEAAVVPESFDSREQWPQCESIRELRDQSNCGSCWAVAAASAMADRICIHSNFTKQTRVSVEDLNSCCKYCGKGCGGGDPFAAWAFWKDSGIVTGGLYQSNQGCKDYTLEPCEHHMNGARPQCSSLNLKTPACIFACQDSSLSYSDSKTFGQTVNYFENEKQIQLEVMTNGPIEVDFTVYTDFVNYKSGVYQPTTDDKEGGHAVKVIGWGVEKGVKYWLMANSWNSDWGMEGYFKIIRGINSCSIEDEGVASLPKL